MELGFWNCVVMVLKIFMYSRYNIECSTKYLKIYSIINVNIYNLHMKLEIAFIKNKVIKEGYNDLFFDVQVSLGFLKILWHYQQSNFNFIKMCVYFFKSYYSSSSSSLQKISDRNLFQANQNYSNSFRYLYPSQCESFRINPKNVLYLVWWKMVKNRSDLIRFNLRQHFEWIRANPKSSFQSRSIRINPILGWFKLNFRSESIRIIPTLDSFRLILIENSVCINQNPDWFGNKTVFHQMRYKTFFRLVRNDSHWLGYR